MENTLWDVVTSPGKTERMTLDQLDASFQAGTISEGTLVREPGTNDWRPLYEIAGLDPPSPEPANVVVPEPNAPVNVPPAIIVPPDVTSAPARLESLESTLDGPGFAKALGANGRGPSNGAALPTPSTTSEPKKQLHTNGQVSTATPPRAGDPLKATLAFGSTLNNPTQAAGGAPPGGPFAPSPSIAAEASGETPSVRVPPPSRVPQIASSTATDQAPASTRSPRTAPRTTGLAAASSAARPTAAARTAPKTTKPPLTPRRTGPSTSKTARGVPLPSVVPTDDLPPEAAALAARAGLQPLASPSNNEALGANPKPLTPPKTTARRVSAPPAAATNGARTRRAPPSILSAPAPNVALTPPPPPPVPVVPPRSAPPPPSGTSLTHSHHPNPELAPWDVGGGVAHQPVPFHGNPLVGTPTPEPVALAHNGVQVLPAPVAITDPTPQAAHGGSADLSGPASSKRLNAPPLPANAFAHLGDAAAVNGHPQPQVQPAVHPTAPMFAVTQPYPAPSVEAPFEPYASPQQLVEPLAPQHQFAPPLGQPPFGHLPSGQPGAPGYAPMGSPAFAPAASGTPASLYNALGFANPPQDAAPFAASANPFAPAAFAAPPAVKGGIPWGEVGIFAVAALVSAFVVLQRNGYTRQWFGPNPQSSYARLEQSLFGQPSIDTVAGVKALLKEVSADENSSGSTPKTTSGGETSAKTGE